MCDHNSLPLTKIDGNKIQKEITDKYLQCVSAAEKEIGSKLDRMREASLAFVDASALSGQKPNFLMFHNIYYSPFWGMSDFPADLKQIFTDFEDLNDRLFNEFIDGINSLSLKKGLTAYHNKK